MKVYTLICANSCGDYITEYMTCGYCWKNADTAYKARCFVENVFSRVCAIYDVDYIIDCLKKGKTYNEVADELENNEDVYVLDSDDWYVRIFCMNVEDINTVMETE